MAGFFERFADVHWDVMSYRYAAETQVEFAFIMTATEAQSGDKIERRGLEQIEFSEDGFISRISVNTG